jgi:hypothetical protein
MLARPTLTRPAQEDASKPKTQARPTEEQFSSKGGWTNQAFVQQQSAATAGAGDKKAYPVVVVTVNEIRTSTSPRSSKPR